jgi:membrane protein YqaA with SNARE-associated domain
MARITAWIEAFALGVGGFGIFIIAFFDSSFLSFPEVNDLLIILMVTRRPERMIYYCSMATLGSVAGCLALYLVARKGGESLLRSRLSGARIEWGTALMRKHGAMALLVPALLPPPAPFKIFVLLAGVSGIPLRSFVLSIAVGRGVRYFGEGLLAVFWGEQALDYLHRNGTTVAIGMAVAVVAGGVAYYLWQKRRK